MVRQINLTESNGRKIEELSRRTGQTQDQIVNSAIERLLPGESAQSPDPDWKSAWRQAAGIWKDRDDIPQLIAQLRDEWNRAAPPESPSK